VTGAGTYVRIDAIAQKDPVAAESVDVAPVAAAFGAALTGLLAGWESIKAAWSSWFVGEVGRVLHAGDRRGLGRLKLPSLDAGRRLVTSATTAFAGTSAGLVAAELDAQGAPAVTQHVPSEADLDAEAEVAVQLLASQLATSLGSEAARVHGPRSSVPHTQQLVHDHAANLTDAQTQYVLGALLHGAGNAARIATLLDVDDVYLYASEVNDTNTCEPCHEIHGTLLGDVNSGDVAKVFEYYPVRGYIDCLGRDRCRGLVVGVWRKAAA